MVSNYKGLLYMSPISDMNTEWKRRFARFRTPFLCYHDPSLNARRSEDLWTFTVEWRLSPAAPALWAVPLPLSLSNTEHWWPCPRLPKNIGRRCRVARPRRKKNCGAPKPISPKPRTLSALSVKLLRAGDRWISWCALLADLRREGFTKRVRKAGIGCSI